MTEPVKTLPVDELGASLVNRAVSLCADFRRVEGQVLNAGKSPRQSKEVTIASARLDGACEILCEFWAASGVEITPGRARDLVHAEWLEKTKKDMEEAERAAIAARSPEGRETSQVFVELFREHPEYHMQAAWEGLIYKRTTQEEFVKNAFRWLGDRSELGSEVLEKADWDEIYEYFKKQMDGE